MRIKGASLAQWAFRFLIIGIMGFFGTAYRGGGMWFVLLCCLLLVLAGVEAVYKKVRDKK